MTSGSPCRSKRIGNSRTSGGVARGACTVVLLAFGYASNSHAAPDLFRVDPELSTAEFAVSYAGVFRQQGRFGRTEGTVVLDPEEDTGAIDLVVDAKSIDTGWSVGDAWLQSEDMFDVARFPVIRFRSTQLSFDHARLVGVAGWLTLRGVTHPVKLEIRRMECGRELDAGREGCDAVAVSRIKRSDYGLSWGLGFIGDDIDLNFRVTASRIDPHSASRR